MAVVRKGPQRVVRRTLLAGAVAQALSGAAAGATMNVTAGEVADVDNGECSIVEAIINANNNDQSGSVDCPAGTAFDTLVLANSVFSLTAVHSYDNALPRIDSHITIEGNDATLRRADAAPQMSIVSIVASGNVTLNDVTVSNGRRSGIVVDDGTLKLNDATLEQNEAASGGALSANNANVFLTRVTLSNNRADNGGGIYARYGSLTLTDCNISANTATVGSGGGLGGRYGTVSLSGGAISDNTAQSGGGGVSQEFGALSVQSTSIRGNTGSSGGGVYVRYGDSVISDVVIASNRAISGSGGGLRARNLDTLTLTNSRIEGNTASGDGGGADLYANHVDVEEATITDNSAGVRGGGIDGYIRNLVISRSNVVGNTAGSSGGGLNLYGRFAGTNEVTGSTIAGNRADTAGGVFVSGFGDTWLTNATISGNSAAQSAGGLALGRGDLLVEHVTFVGNQAGIGARTVAFDVNSGAVTLRNSIIAGGFGAAGIECEIANGGFDANVANIIEDGSCGAGAVGLIAQDPELGPLALNGGPTRSHSPLESSPAINQGDAASCTATDQRGVARIAVACDIGALEVTAPILVDAIVGAGVMEVDANDGQCSLPEAMLNANNDAQLSPQAGECEAGLSGAADRIVLPAQATFKVTDADPTNPANGLPEVTADMIIDGDGATILRSSASPFRLIQNSGRLTLNQLTLQDGASARGGAVLNAGTLDLIESNLLGNQADLYGGGLSNTGVATIEGSTLAGNTALGGAGIDNYGTVTLTNSTISGNTAVSLGGGAIYSASGAATIIRHSTLAFNVVPEARRGSQLYAAAGRLDVFNSILADSKADLADCYTAQPLTANAGNLIEDGTCAPALSGTGGALLEALSENGGQTLTHDLIYANNPAIEGADQAQCSGIPYDQRGAPFERAVDADVDTMADCDIGAVEFVDLLNPTANLSAADVDSDGAAFYEFVIRFDDDSAIDLGSISVGNVSVIGPMGSLPKVSVTTQVVSESEINATYRVTPPGGAWDDADNGAYAIDLAANQVDDITGKFVAGATLGTFTVSIASPEINVAGRGVSIEDGDDTPTVADHTHFGDVDAGDTVTREFTIENNGDAPLVLTGSPRVRVIGAGFAVSAQPDAGTVPIGGALTFEISFTAGALGTSTAVVNVESDDVDEPLYDFALQARSVTPGTGDPIFADGFE